MSGLSSMQLVLLLRFAVFGSSCCWAQGAPIAVGDPIVIARMNDLSFLRGAVLQGNPPSLPRGTQGLRVVVSY